MYYYAFTTSDTLVSNFPQVMVAIRILNEEPNGLPPDLFSQFESANRSVRGFIAKQSIKTRLIVGWFTFFFLFWASLGGWNPLGRDGRDQSTCWQKSPHHDMLWVARCDYDYYMLCVIASLPLFWLVWQYFSMLITILTRSIWEVLYLPFSSFHLCDFAWMRRNTAR